jgi:hypothetical protein
VVSRAELQAMFDQAAKMLADAGPGMTVNAVPVDPKGSSWRLVLVPAATY